MSTVVSSLKVPLNVALLSFLPLTDTEFLSAFLAAFLLVFAFSPLLKFFDYFLSSTSLIFHACVSPFPQVLAFSAVSSLPSFPNILH